MILIPISQAIAFSKGSVQYLIHPDAAVFIPPSKSKTLSFHSPTMSRRYKVDTPPNPQTMNFRDADDGLVALFRISTSTTSRHFKGTKIRCVTSQLLGDPSKTDWGCFFRRISPKCFMYGIIYLYLPIFTFTYICLKLMGNVGKLFHTWSIWDWDIGI